VEILYACNQLRIDLRSLLLLEPCVSHDEVKQLAAVSVLHNHEKFLVSLDDLIFSVVEREWGGVTYLIELDYVGVANFL
jgi:hypothetical protein